VDTKPEGKVAIVTGASKGIGRAISLELARNGYHIVVNYHSDEKGAIETLAMIRREGGDGDIMQFDVSNHTETQNAFDDEFSYLLEVKSA